MLLNIQTEVEVWLLIWAFIGATLGFFTIRNTPVWTRSERIKQYLLSIGVGIFFAFPTYATLQEYEVCSMQLNVMISGTVSFVISDIIIDYWKRILSGIGRICHKIADHLIGKL